MMSALRCDLLRYRRSTGLWLMIIAAPIAARLMISDEQGRGVAIAIGNQLPMLTSPVIGVWLGIVVSTLIMPIAFVYLRANTTRVQPWQVEDVTGTHPVSILMGRFLADSAILLLALIVLSASGAFLGWVMLDRGWSPIEIIYPLWIVAAPGLIVVAAVKALFDALPVLRGALGETTFLVLWALALSVPLLQQDAPSSLLTNIIDVGGYARPLIEGAPAGSREFAVGSLILEPGRVQLDVDRGLEAPGYWLSRLFWVLAAIVMVLLAGLLYRPRQGQRKATMPLKSLINDRPSAPTVIARPPSSKPVKSIGFGLIRTEARLLLGSNLQVWLLSATAFAAVVPLLRETALAAALLVSIFAFSNHAGRMEAVGYRSLTRTAAIDVWHQRGAYLVAGTTIAVLVSVPASLASLSIGPAFEVGTLGGMAACIAGISALLTKSAFVGRIVLLVAWYGYFAG